MSSVHLNNGDYLLIGPERFTDLRTSRGRDNELWYLNRQKGSKPVKLGQKISEGAAVSKESMTLAFSVTSVQDPSMKPGSSKLVIAEFDPAGPSLKNQAVILESPDRSCFIEAQDFSSATAA